MFPEKAKAFDGRGIGGNLNALGIAGLNWSLRLCEIAVIGPVIPDQ